MQLNADPSDPQAVIAEAETRHDAYDLCALKTVFEAANRKVELIHEHPTKPDYIALRLWIAQA